MALRLNGSNTGYVELDVPADAGSHTLTLPNNDGDANQVLSTDGAGALSWATLPAAGKILQVVQGSTNTQTSVTTSTYTDVGLSASITPSSTSSKVLVSVSSTVYLTSASYNSFGSVIILRGSTEIIEQHFATDISISGSGPTAGFAACPAILDSPSSTSSLTYKVQVKLISTSYNPTLKFNYDYNSSTDSTSTITLMEVAV